MSAAEQSRAAADVLAVALAHEPVPADDVVAGAPTTAAAELATLPGVQVGLWEITPGTVTDTEADEVFVVLAGRGTVTFEDGSRLDLGPGTAARLRAGQRTTWTITETLRKVYVLADAPRTDEKETA